MRVLFEVGLISGQKGDRVMKVSIVENEIKEHISNIGDRIYVDALLD